MAEDEIWWSAATALALLVGSGAAAALLSFSPTFRRKAVGIGSLGAGIGSLLLGWTAVRLLLTGTVTQLSLPTSIPSFAPTLALDPLSAFFLILMGIAGITASTYAVGYYRHPHSTQRAGVAFLLTNGLIASMAGVAMAADVLTFLVAWEVMTMTSFGLVALEHERRENARAAYTYLATTHVGTGFLIAAFFLLAGAAGGSRFDDFRVLAIIPHTGWLVLFLIVGFGTKAGLYPLHGWLPLAHPAAPSPASALMSGVMIKLGIYGLVRFLFDLLPAVDSAWGILLLALALASSFFGVAQALTQHDLKRLLAYHSVENIGIILLGVAMAILFRSAGLGGLAAAALTGGLLHTLNHMLFKSLLFYGAGAIQQGAGVRDVEHLGGLLRRMPWTGLSFLVGALAICAIPPLNGFASEWLVYRALLQGTSLPYPHQQLLSVVGAAVLALVGGLALACFVKAFGTVFLGMPRSAGAGAAIEASPAMRAAMTASAALCVLLGVFPALAVIPIQKVIGSLRAFQVMPIAPISAWPALGGGDGTFAAWAVALAVSGAWAGALLVPWILRTPVRCYRTWDCGYAHLSPRTQYSAYAFVQPLLVIFSKVYRSRARIRVNRKYFPSQIRYGVRRFPAIDRRLLDLGGRLAVMFSAQVNRLQAGSIHLYLLYMFVTAVGLMIFAATR